MAEPCATKPAANGAARALTPSGMTPVPEAVWRELRPMLDPSSHFYGELTIVVQDSRIVRVERVARVRTTLKD